MEMRESAVAATLRMGLTVWVCAATAEGGRADVTDAWVVRFGEGFSAASSAEALVLDPAGFLYVSGTGGEPPRLDFVTVKYDLGGNELWSARYDGSDEEDRVEAATLCRDGVCVDGGVVVTGTSREGEEGWSAAVVRYAASGDVSWTYRYRGGRGSATPEAIAVTSEGRILIAGTHENTGVEPALFLLHLSPEGKFLWDVIVPSGNGKAVVADADGNAYVAGMVRGRGAPGGGLPQDTFLAKYDREGTEEWAVRHDVGRTESARALALRADGTILVAGRSSPVGTKNEYEVLAYDSQGTPLWRRIYPGGENDGGSPDYIRTDREGNVIVTGSMGSRPPGADIVTVKWSPRGRLLWVRRYDGPGEGVDNARGLSVDAAGNIYVAGTVRVDDDPRRDEMVAMCYAPDGEEKWLRRHGEAAPAMEEARTEAAALQVDPAGNVYVTGASRFGSEPAFVTVRYGQPFVRGDVDGDGELHMSDAVTWLRWVFLRDRGPPCVEAADVDDDGQLGIDDPVFLLLRLFGGGAEPPAPISCGFDPRAGVFRCEAFPACP